MTTDLLLLSQEETSPFYSAVNSYFLDPLLEPPALPLGKFSAAPPLGLTLLASAARAGGLAAVPLYNFFSREKEKERLAAELEKKPFAAGISTTHAFDPATLRAAAGLVKRLSPSTHLIAGGPGAEWNPDLRPEGAWTVFGPGEEALPALVQALKEGRDPGRLPGVVRPGAAAPEVPAAPPPIERQPLPDWGLYPQTPAGVAVQGSRGCPRACGFCSYSAPYEARGAAAVLAELRANAARGIRRFRFTDSDFPGDAALALEICRGLEGCGLSWTCFARADSLLRPGLAEAMRRAGCLWVFIGAESGSDEILRAMDKGCGVGELREGVAAARAAGLGVHGNFVVGYPGETRRTLRETAAFARTAGFDTVYFSPFQLRSPGIPALREKQGGLAPEPGGWRHSTMGSGEMLKYSAELQRELAADPAAPLPGSEALFLLFSDVQAGKFRLAVEEFFGAFRRWHAGDRAAARRTLEKYL